MRSKPSGDSLFLSWMQYSALKIRLLLALAFTVFLYGCVSWTLTGELQQRIQSLEMRCYRIPRHLLRRLHHKWRSERHHQTRKGPIGRRHICRRGGKVKWYGHVTRGNNPSSAIRQGTNLTKKKRQIEGENEMTTSLDGLEDDGTQQTYMEGDG